MTFFRNCHIAGYGDHHTDTRTDRDDYPIARFNCDPAPAQADNRVLSLGISVLPHFPWGRLSSPSQYSLTQQIEIRSAIHTSLD